MAVEITERLLTEVRNAMLNSVNGAVAFFRPKYIVLKWEDITGKAYWEIFDISLYSQTVNPYQNIYRGYYENNYEFGIQILKEYVVGETSSGNLTKQEIKRLFEEGGDTGDVTKYILVVSTPDEPYTIQSGAIQGYKYVAEFST